MTGPDAKDDAFPLFCARCRCTLAPGRGNFYVVRIEAVADPFPPEFTADDLSDDLDARWRRLLREMHGLSAQEAMDQVYRRTTLHLCASCYARWIEDPAGP
jgi:hypothetical protein